MSSMSTWPKLPKSNSDVPADIEGALRELGVNITSIDDTDITGYCPWHDEGTAEQKKPKWAMLTEGYYDRNGNWVKPGMFNCFSCGFSGDFRYLVMKLLDCDMTEADSWIAHHKVIDLDRAQDKLHKETMKPILPLYIVTEEYFHTFPYPPAEVLETRKLLVDTARAYDVRWDGEHYLIPIRDGNALIGWQKKHAAQRFFMNVPKHMRMHHTLFGLQNARKGHVVLVESPLDVLWCAQNDINAVAMFGKKISAEQMQLVLDNFDTVIVALDTDARKESLELKRTFSHRIPMWFFNYKGLSGDDPGELDPIELHLGLANAIFAPEFD